MLSCAVISAVFCAVCYVPLCTGKRALKRVTPILGGFSREDYVTERLWARAADGVEVPISLVYRKGLVKKDGSDHMLLHGYGSYEYPYDPRQGSHV